MVHQCINSEISKVCFAHFDFFEISTPDAHHANYGKHTLNHHFRHGAKYIKQCFAFRNISLFCTF